MNSEIVIWNECMNDGRTIHLYRDGAMGLWCAYGYSALGVMLFNRKFGLHNTGSYSREINMQVTLVDDNCLRALTDYSLTSEKNGGHVSLMMSDVVDAEFYQIWVRRLRVDCGIDTKTK